MFVPLDQQYMHSHDQRPLSGPSVSLAECWLLARCCLDSNGQKLTQRGWPRAVAHAAATYCKTVHQTGYVFIYVCPR
jgi:hypothetical protein